MYIKGVKVNTFFLVHSVVGFYSGWCSWYNNGIMIPLLADDADGATVDGRVSVDDTKGVPVNEGSVDSADGAAVDDVISLLATNVDGATVNGGILVDNAGGVLIDKGISVGGEEHEVSVLMPIGGGVVDALASTEVPVEAGT